MSSALRAPGRKCILSQEMAAHSVPGAQVGGKSSSIPAGPLTLVTCHPDLGRAQAERGGVQPAAGIGLGGGGRARARTPRDQHEFGLLLTAEGSSE